MNKKDADTVDYQWCPWTLHIVVLYIGVSLNVWKILNFKVLSSSYFLDCLPKNVEIPIALQKWSLFFKIL